MVEFTDEIGAHVAVVVEGDGHGGDRLAFGVAAKGRAAPVAVASQFVLRLPAFPAELADDAARIAVIAAVIDHRALLAVPVFIDQILFFHAHAQMIPGQDLVEAAFTTGVPIHIEAGIGKGLLPGIPGKLITPGIEAGAETPGAFDDIRQLAIPAAEEGLHERFTRVIGG